MCNLPKKFVEKEVFQLVTIKGGREREE